MENYQTPRGTQDLLPEATRKWQKVEDLIRNLCDVYGYEAIRTPVFEDTRVFKRENDSSDMVNKEMYTFSVHGEDSLTLRPEGTAGVVRSFVQHKMYGRPTGARCASTSRTASVSCAQTASAAMNKIRCGFWTARSITNIQACRTCRRCSSI